MASPSFSDAVIDGGLDYIVNNVTAVSVCSSDPNGVYANIAGSELVKYTGLTSGDFTKAAGDSTGRKVSIGTQTGNNGTATGAANFVVFHNNTDTWYGTVDGDGDTINTGSPADINSGKIWEIADPT